MIPSDMDAACKDKVRRVGTGIIEMDPVLVDNYDDQPENRTYWNETFFKLNLARLLQFEKVVYLDADMLVLKNVDALFSYPSITAAVSGKCANPEWVEMNSGLLVLKPDLSMYNGLIAKIDPAIKRKRAMGEGFGDQDVFNEFCPEWPAMPDHDCGESYNASVCFLDKMEGVRSIHALHILHYIGPVKVWERSLLQTARDIYSCLRTKRPLEAKAYIIYRYNMLGLRKGA